MDVNCAHCGEPWEVYGLRHDEEKGTYQKVLSGKGCPSCGYNHSGKEGAHRLRQIEALVMDGVTDDDPLLFF